MLKRLSLLPATPVMALTMVAGPAFAGDYDYGKDKGNDHKVTICHKGKTISVDKHALKAHLKHGDYKDKCKKDKDKKDKDKKDKKHKEDKHKKDKDRDNHKKHYNKGECKKDKDNH